VMRSERKIGRRRLSETYLVHFHERARGRRPAPCVPSEPFPRLWRRAHGCVAAERAMRRVVGLPRSSACPTISRRGDYGTLDLARLRRAPVLAGHPSSTPRFPRPCSRSEPSPCFLCTGR
jgi:hypothetical protein